MASALKEYDVSLAQASGVMTWTIGWSVFGEHFNRSAAAAKIVESSAVPPGQAARLGTRAGSDGGKSLWHART